jgi:hypothetical protein
MTRHCCLHRDTPDCDTYLHGGPSCHICSSTSHSSASASNSSGPFVLYLHLSRELPCCSYSVTTLSRHSPLLSLGSYFVQPQRHYSIWVQPSILFCIHACKKNAGYKFVSLRFLIRFTFIASAVGTRVSHWDSGTSTHDVNLL